MDMLTVYDIANPKRLRRIAKLMERYGKRVQKSVFECRISMVAVLRMEEEAKEIMDPDFDSVRVYPLLAGALLKQDILGIGAPPEPSLSAVIA